MKKCYRCNIVKSYSEFYIDKKRSDGYGYTCKPCASILNKEWRKRNLDKARKTCREADKKYRSSKPNYQASKNAKKYGLTLNEYLDITSKPCYICTERLGNCIDHDHTTGKVRGGLCSNCNAALGHFKDNPEWLSRAIEYLTGGSQVVKASV